jgi:hypothetical protein
LRFYVKKTKYNQITMTNPPAAGQSIGFWSYLKFSVPLAQKQLNGFAILPQTSNAEGLPMP